jgi:hypothetical protein
VENVAVAVAVADAEVETGAVAPRTLYRERTE